MALPFAWCSILAIMASVVTISAGVLCAAIALVLQGFEPTSTFSKYAIDREVELIRMLEQGTAENSNITDSNARALDVAKRTKAIADKKREIEIIRHTQSLRQDSSIHNIRLACFAVCTSSVISTLMLYSLYVAGDHVFCTRGAMFRPKRADRVKNYMLPSQIIAVNIASIISIAVIYFFVLKVAENWARHVPSLDVDANGKPVIIRLVASDIPAIKTIHIIAKRTTYLLAGAQILLLIMSIVYISTDKSCIESAAASTAQ